MSALFHLFSFLGWALDSTRLTLSASSRRWGPIRAQMLSGVGALGLAVVCAVLAMLGLATTWYGGTHPSPAKFFQVAHPTDTPAQPLPPGAVRTKSGLIGLQVGDASYAVGRAVDHEAGSLQPARKGGAQPVGVFDQ